MELYFRAAIILTLLALAGCTQMSSLYQMSMSSLYSKGSDYEQAVSLYEKGMLFEARQKAQEVRKTDINYKASSRLIADINTLLLQIARRHMEMGEDYEKAGIYNKAVAEYGISLKYNPSNILVLNKMANLIEAMKEGRRVEAEKEKPAPKKKPVKVEEDPEVLANTHYMKGKIYLESKAYAKAIEEFNSVLTYVPTYMNTKELLERSKKERDKAVDRHLKNGIGYFQAEEMDLAIKEWDAVLELDPENKKAADYKYRAEVILERLKKIRERKADVERPL